MKPFRLFSIAALALAFAAGVSQAQDVKDPFRQPALDSLKGKKIAYLPISLGFNMANAWGGVVKSEANRYGMKFITQAPNLEHRGDGPGSHQPDHREAGRDRHAEPRHQLAGPPAQESQ